MHWAKIKLSRAIFLSSLLCTQRPGATAAAQWRLTSGGAASDVALLQINEQAEAFRALHLIYVQAVETFLFTNIRSGLRILQLVMIFLVTKIIIFSPPWVEIII